MSRSNSDPVVEYEEHEFTPGEGEANGQPRFPKAALRPQPQRGPRMKRATDEGRHAADTPPAQGFVSAPRGEVTTEPQTLAL